MLRSGQNITSKGSAYSDMDGRREAEGLKDSKTNRIIVYMLTEKERKHRREEGKNNSSNRTLATHH